MNDTHVGENAALYAMGALDAQERETYDRHAQVCDACARALADASQTIEAMERRAGIVPAPRALLAGRRRARLRPFAAGLVAAAAAVAAIFLFARLFAVSGAVHGNELALAALVHSHFDHSPFVAQRVGAPAAKVMYARDGSWLFVVVDRPSVPLEVDGIAANGAALSLAQLPRSDVAVSAFSRPARRFVRVELREANGAVVSRAELAYRAQ
jgi:hypothetical protein